MKQINRVVAVVENALKHILLEPQFAYHPFLYGAYGNEVSLLDIALLTKAVYPAYALFENGGIPRQVEVDDYLLGLFSFDICFVYSAKYITVFSETLVIRIIFSVVYSSFGGKVRENIEITKRIEGNC